jgi:hydrogenase maturation protease
VKPEGRVLVYGYGNPGRVDDGLGPALASALERGAPHGVEVDANYQLVLEDAAAVAAHEVVLFVDASVSGPAPFSLAPVVADRRGARFSTHSVGAGELLALAEDLSGRPAVAFVMGVRGYEFDEFDERLSPQAERNLRAAVQFVRSGLAEPDFTAYLERHLTTTPPLTDIDVRPGA